MKIGCRYNARMMGYDRFHGRLQKGLLHSLVLILCGCGANRGPGGTALDLSAPKPAALSFLRAIAKGDARAAKAASLGSDQDKQWVDAMAGIIAGLRAYDQALVGRFGSPAISIDNDLKQAIQTMADEPIMRLEGGIVKEFGDTAEVDPALNGERLSARPPIYLRKDKGLWKVDLPAMKDDPEHDPAVVEQYRVAGKALQQAAQEIRRGKYKTLDEAFSASDVLH